MVRVVFLHPDLGIGGAERLVVDAALALKSKGHQVYCLTSHHDISHCFEETRNGDLPVTCVGDWLPRNILGRCYALCAYIRMVYAAIYLCFFIGKTLRPEVVFCDQISACIPFLKIGPYKPEKILFYCHYPDLLLTQRKSLFKKLYRAPIDWIEEKTTAMADIVMVNSKFTAGVFHDTFQNLDIHLEVLYPSLNPKNFDACMAKLGGQLGNTIFTMLSVNRYERKKNLPLALRALGNLKHTRCLNAKLIIMGGFDNGNLENHQHLIELEDLVEELDLGDDVTFMKSPSNEEKVTLLLKSDCLLYTPSNEHFGIVPVEAMYVGLPVVAVNDGGPTETVVHEETGFLCEPTEEAFADAIERLYKGGAELKQRLGRAGRKRVMKFFSFSAFADQLDKVIGV